MDASRFKKGGIVLLALCAGLAVFVGTFWLGKEIQKQSREPTRLAIDQVLEDDFLSQFNQVKIPDEKMVFPGTSFLGPDETMTKISVGEGEYALVNIWATWCAPCVVELPSLDILADNMQGSPVQVKAISIDNGKEFDVLRLYLETRRIGNFALHYDQSGSLRTELPLRGIPTSFLIGEGNEILYILEGDIDWASPPSRAFFETLTAPNSQTNANIY